jgi:hypothetical protein
MNYSYTEQGLTTQEHTNSYAGTLTPVRLLERTNCMRDEPWSFGTPDKTPCEAHTNSCAERQQ